MIKPSCPSQKVLILGASGMLGHTLLTRLPAHLSPTGIVPRKKEAYGHIGAFNGRKILYGVDARDHRLLKKAIEASCPSLVINCCGVIKQIFNAHTDTDIVVLNALLPHWLEAWAEELDFRLIHISTDCVFSGKRGMYLESDVPDPVDFYGRSKLLGEVSGPRSLTLRTSFIGREIDRKTGLLEWFLSQRQGKVKGYRKAVFSGLTTGEVANFLAAVLGENVKLCGLYNLAADPISKYDLLVLCKKIFGACVEIVPDDSMVYDRSLDASALRKAIGWRAPSWEKMVQAMAGEKET